MRLVCIVNAQTPYSGELLEKSAARVGVEIVRYGEGEPWPHDYRIGKLVRGIECVKSLPEDVTHVMFVDSSDSLFLAGPEEIIAKYEQLRNSGPSCPYEVLIQGEKNCYPDKALRGLYDGLKESPWCYVNSGGWICRRERALSYMGRAASWATYCDQLCWTKYYLGGGSIKVDQNCEIFQSMYLQDPEEFSFMPIGLGIMPDRDGRLTNNITRTKPCVMHWNGTKNQGVPYSRDGVWGMLVPDDGVEGLLIPEKNDFGVPQDPVLVPRKHVPPMPAKRICVCIPGNNFSYLWMMKWTELFTRLCRQFHVGMVFAQSNNIYLVREQCLKTAFSNPDGEPDYLLWIDSDNPPSAEGFDHLIGCMEASSQISVIGGWYRYFDPQSLEVRVAAGCLEDPYRNISEQEVLGAEKIIEVPFVGLGFCLMRSSVVKDIGIERCFEPYFYPDPKNRRFATDDDGFGFRAREKGHRIFLHPAVFVPHEKPMHVPASFENRHEIPELKEH